MARPQDKARAGSAEALDRPFAANEKAHAAPDGAFSRRPEEYPAAAPTVRDRLMQFGARALSQLPPETAHNVTIRLLASGLLRGAPPNSPSSLAVRVAGVDFPNPIGLAAGFDKNAQAPDACFRLGFGFVEVGAVTPRAQPGNPRPRVFRLCADRAVINRYGFNNDGAARIAARLRRRRIARPLGVNLGANKDSADRVDDYVAGLAAFDGLADFFTVNISSPNTPGLRALQDAAALRELLARVERARDAMSTPAPLFLKIAPDLTDEDKADIAAAVSASSFDGLIVANTTTARPDALRGAARAEAGGLSGAPLLKRSTALLRDFYSALGERTPLIGVGGVASARDAYEKILHGASLVQLYTAMIYEGPGLPARIVRELPDLIARDGFAGAAEARGAKC